MNILFSPIGNTDPVSNDLDGAMLHICRHYPIDRVVMFMSKDICVNHRNDDRYVKSLELLSDHLGRKTDCEIIECPELENVHIFDSFLETFSGILADLHARFPEANIYLNVSSGTPAMKSSLQILAAYRDFDYKPIQVAGPGYTPAGYKPFDAVSAFENDFDNLPERENRCRTSSNVNLLTEAKKKMLTALIDKYEYSGAYTLAKDIPGLNKSFLTLLKAVDLRSKFELGAAREKFAEAGQEVTFYSEPAEYLLILWLKNQKNEIADFLRAVTPLTYELNKAALKVCCGFDIEDFTENTDRGLKWSLYKIKTAANSGDTAAAKALTVSGIQDGRTVYPNTLHDLLRTVSKDEDLKAVFQHLREVEEARNPIAHNITSINRADLHGKGAGSLDSILKDLYKACIKTRCLQIEKGYNENSFSKHLFAEYVRLNKILTDLLE